MVTVHRKPGLNVFDVKILIIFRFVSKSKKTNNHTFSPFRSKSELKYTIIKQILTRNLLFRWNDINSKKIYMIMRYVYE